ncbi:RAD50-interacting protein 1-like [Dreissena polymorpha]|uniref:RAD50-interacting protein 1 n=1 Tax=Dreissena polymorpha TaxID=45954 RepID=A0A9D4LTY6_DREPO|nr:RAD50-interacting protein 1-like [Dreissena polymorpha]KAH3863718.1 hypothetical protein DPMN_026708 [Dreissena polymorpha]
MAAPMDTKTSSETFTIDFVNKQFGSDLKKLQLVVNVYQTHKEKQANLTKQLSLASSEAPSELEQGIKNAEKARSDVRKLRDRNDRLYHEIQDQTRDLSTVVKETSALSAEISELEQLTKYLQCVKKVDTTSSQIEVLLQSDNLLKSVDKFAELSALYTNLGTSKCHNMVKYVKDTTIYWYKNLKNKIASEFEETLKQMKWPLVAMSIKAPPVQNTAEAKTKMELLFKQLLKLQLPSSLQGEVEQLPSCVASMPGIRIPILPLSLMVKPLRRRFKYHFFGNKQTNDLAKPEWYFTQTISWIRDHLVFLEQRVQPLLLEAGTQTNVKTEFMVAMTTLVMEKMLTDLPELMNDDHQFSHLVDEALLFDREMRMSYAYPTCLPGALHVLSQDTYFRKWLHIEHKFATEKLDGMMSSYTAWDSQYKHIADVDEQKVPECGDSFMTLLLTITDRYKSLPEPALQLEFLDLQLELLEDFRVRLNQVKNNTHNILSGQYCAILNTAHFVADVLREWSELVFFLQLQYFKMVNTSSTKQSLSEDDIPFGYTTLFDEMISLYSHLENDMLSTLVSQVAMDVRSRGKPYKDDRWISLPHQKEMTLGLSTSACEMLLVLKDHLLDVSELVSKPVFTHFWEKMAANLNQYIFEEVILRNKFNQGGAGQLQFDMQRNMFPLFGEYTSKPESYFKEVKEACFLLNLNVGSAILLKETLYEALHTLPREPDRISQAKAALSDVGVFKLTLDQSELVLSLRTHMAT